MLTVLYDNPLSSWAGAGICVYPIDTWVNGDLYNKMFAAMKRYAETVKWIKPPTVNVYDGCIYYQNINWELK